MLARRLRFANSHKFVFSSSLGRRQSQYAQPLRLKSVSEESNPTIPTTTRTLRISSKYDSSTRTSLGQSIQLTHSLVPTCQPQTKIPLFTRHIINWLLIPIWKPFLDQWPDHESPSFFFFIGPSGVKDTICFALSSLSFLLAMIEVLSSAATKSLHALGRGETEFLVIFFDARVAFRRSSFWFLKALEFEWRPCRAREGRKIA